MISPQLHNYKNIMKGKKALPVNGSVWFALILTLFAGLSSGIGGLFTLFCKSTNTRILSVVLGFSAGVMIYVSFTEILNEARISIGSVAGNKTNIITAAAFFGGILLIAIIDKLIPSYENPHESYKIEEKNKCRIFENNRNNPDFKELRSKKLLRTGVFTALAITIHNFPEGIAAFASAIENPSLGIIIAVAIAIHNIPEGIAVSVPVYCATGSKKKAVGLSFLSGLSEPLGALIGYIILMRFLNELVFGILFAAVAGIMVFISFDELLPSAREYGEHHLSILGLVGGMAVMSISLLLIT